MIVFDFFLAIMPFYNRQPGSSKKGQLPSIPAKIKSLSRAQEAVWSLPELFILFLDSFEVLHVASQIEKLKKIRSGWKLVCGVWHGVKDVL